MISNEERENSKIAKLMCVENVIKSRVGEKFCIALKKVQRDSCHIKPILSCYVQDNTIFSTNIDKVKKDSLIDTIF